MLKAKITSPDAPNARAMFAPIIEHYMGVVLVTILTLMILF